MTEEVEDWNLQNGVQPLNVAEELRSRAFGEGFDEGRKEGYEEAMEESREDMSSQLEDEYDRGRVEGFEEGAEAAKEEIFYGELRRLGISYDDTTEEMNIVLPNFPNPVYFRYDHNGLYFECRTTGRKFHVVEVE